jgi:hypothetical protein
MMASGRVIVKAWWLDDLGDRHDSWAFDLDSTAEVASEVR